MSTLTLSRLQMGEITVVKGTDQDVENATALVNDTELKANVRANTLYDVRIRLLYSGNSIAADYSCDVTWPSGLSQGITKNWNTSDASSGFVGIGVLAGGTGTSLFSLGVDASHTTRMAFINVFIRPGSDGQVQFRFAQAVATVSTQARTKAGTTMVVRKLT